MCLEKGSFGSCSASGDEGQMTHLEARFAWGGGEGLENEGNFAN